MASGSPENVGAMTATITESPLPPLRAVSYVLVSTPIKPVVVPSQRASRFPRSGRRTDGERWRWAR